jgi:hypothetical protein
MITPPTTPLPGALPALRRDGHAVLAPADLEALAGAPLAPVTPAWDDLPPDGYLRDGGRYRRRRHGCFVVEGGVVRAVPARPHWQPVDYNALHGGLERWYAPLAPPLAGSPLLDGLLRGLAGLLDVWKGPRPWFSEVHPFRIDTTDGIGRPTPEGAHRDGVDLVAVVLVARAGVKGGETRVFDGPAGLRFTMTAPGTTLLLDDARVVHETTPLQPTGPDKGHRDTLVITLRAGGFQGP